MHFEIAFNMGEVLNCLSFVRQLKYDLSYCIPKGLTFLKKLMILLITLEHPNDKKLFLGSVVFSLVMSAVGCTKQAANLGQASLDDFCRQFPMSASCPDGKNAIAKQDAFCAEFPLSVTCPDGRAAIQKKNSFCTQFPMSASCPEGKAAIEKKTKWCADFPTSAVRS